jgi:hypothetical protein
MLKLKYIVVFIGLAVLVSSCFQEEDIITLPPTNGDLEVGVAEMTDDYRYQVYYDLATNTAATSVLNTSWDLGFACSDTTWQIVLNNSKAMFAGNTGLKDFSQVTSASNVKFKFDAPSGNKDSLAINEWIDYQDEKPVASGFVYIIDRGTDENFAQIGYKKVIFETPGKDDYKIRFANLDGSGEQVVTIQKDSIKNFVSFSFDRGIVDVEPPKDEWTLLFTSYQTVLYTDIGEAVPYLVRGVMLNPYLTEAALDTSLVFSEISLNDTSLINLSNRRDFIGHEWKYYDFDDGIYSVLNNRNYIIRGQDRYFYKLRFISFYNNLNQKGYPAFEFMRM